MGTLKKLPKENTENEKHAERYIEKGIALARKLSLERFNIFVNDVVTGIELIAPPPSKMEEDLIKTFELDFKVEVRASKFLSLPQKVFLPQANFDPCPSFPDLSSLHDGDPRHPLGIREEQFLNMGRVPSNDLFS